MREEGRRPVPEEAGEAVARPRAAGRPEQPNAPLTDVAWMRARLLERGGVHALIGYYGHTEDVLAVEVGRALLLSAGALAVDPGLLRGQLADRLAGHPVDRVAAWARSLTGHAPSRRPGTGAWLGSVTPVLSPSGGPLTRILHGHTGPVSGVAISADGTRAVIGAARDTRIGVWDLTGRRETRVLTGHTPGVTSVAISPDGTRAVTGGADREVRVWDLADPGRPVVLTGHDREVTSVALAPGGGHVVSAAADKTARVWDPAAGRRIACWAGEYSIMGCTPLAGRPRTIAVAQQWPPPYLLRLYPGPS